jgi:hypothetical protein
MLALDKDEKHGSKNPPPAAPPHLNGKRTEPDSGLIDLKALADGEISTSMNNIEKQNERDAAILASTSSQSLAQIVLPIVGREGKTPIEDEHDAKAVAAAAVATGGKPVAKQSKSHTGLIAVIAIGLVGAAAAAFYFIKKSEKKSDAPVAANTSDTEDMAAGGGQGMQPPPTTGMEPGSQMVTGGGTPGDPSGGGPIVQPLDTAGGNQVALPAGGKKDDGKKDDGKKDDGKKTDAKADAKKDDAKKADAKKDDGKKDDGKVVATGDQPKDLDVGPATKPKDDGQSEIQKLLAGSDDDKKVDEAPKKTGLDKDEIKAGMGKVKAIVQNCAKSEKVVGVIKVRATIAPSGSVSNAAVTGEFASNPVASCVKDAISAASFPSWTGSPMTVNYSYSVD